jgi:hypothetical protein
VIPAAATRTFTSLTSGLSHRPSAANQSLDDVNIHNFVEFVRITRPDGTTYDDPLTLNWHSKTWISRPGTVWAVDTGKSRIGLGQQASLSP